MPAFATSDLDRSVLLLDLGERSLDRFGIGDVALHREEALGWLT